MILINVKTLCANVSDVIRQTDEEKEIFVIMKYGRPVAIIKPVPKDALELKNKYARKETFRPS